MNTSLQLLLFIEFMLLFNKFILSLLCFVRFVSNYFFCKKSTLYTYSDKCFRFIFIEREMYSLMNVNALLCVMIVPKPFVFIMTYIY